MTVPHDEQPLTRRALRELERQKPRKQQKEDARAAEEADAERRAGAESSTPVAPAGPAATVTPAEPSAAETVPVEPASSSGQASSPDAAAPAETQAGSAVPFAPASTVVATPALSRRARRALSSDHPFAGPEVTGPPTAATVSAATTSAGAYATAPSADPSADPSTGPIIAEIIPESPSTDTIEVVETGAVRAVDARRDEEHPAGENTSEVAVPIVEELIVIDDAEDAGSASREDEELAEIDDTVPPGAVHVITIDENPSGPILSPLFPAPADREVTRADPTDSSFDNLIASRGVGASNSVSTTSALVLPSVPHHGDVGTALDETGEVIITGSIDLPMSLGSMGAAPADGLESSELDAYLDPDGDVGSDVAPVSATRAVSTHGSTSGLIAPPKRGRTNAPVILGIIAGVLGVGVVGLLVAVFALRIF